MSDYVIYEERSSWPLGVAVTVWGVCLSSAVATVAAGGGSPAALIGAAMLCALPFVVWLLVGTLVVKVTRTSLLIAFGSASLIQKLVSFGQISSVEPVRYRPVLEFGGWGIRFGWRSGKRAWTIRGDGAVVLHLTDGTRLYVGSDTPELLAERIRFASGGRVGEGAP